jgi:hypothetical protein
VNSLGRSVDIFRYHLFTARDALEGILGDRQSVAEALDVLYGEQQQEYHRARVVSEAHVHGCFHVTRNMFDIFAQLVNGLVLSPPIGVEDCDIGQVHRKLTPSDLKSHVGELLESPWFDYVTAFVNTIKHRRLVPHSFTILPQENFAGMRIGAFEYRGKPYPSYPAIEVLQSVMEVKNRIVNCGRALSAHVGIDA